MDISGPTSRRGYCAEHDGKLYFGTDDGKVMVFSGEYADDGRAIDAIWTTPLLDGGNFMQEKNISRRGNGNFDQFMPEAREKSLPRKIVDAGPGIYHGSDGF